RLQSVHAMIDSPEMRSRFVMIEPRFATEAELKMGHTQSYIDTVAETAEQNHTWLDPDTETSPHTYTTAQLAVGGIFNAVDAVVNGKVNNAFALVRPPGHHAHARGAAGFCVFSNIAIGAKYAMKKYGYERILIVDWDLHHGDGTQEAFYDSKNVLFFSSHQYPYYPGSGSVNEIGAGDGLGYTINVPLVAGAGDAEYLKIYQQVLVPVAMAFKPELILVSAGFDIYFMDPLGGMKITPDGFSYLTRLVMEIANACCNGKVVFCLEGGYHLAGLTASVKSVLMEMSGETNASQKFLTMFAQGASSNYNEIIKKVQDKIQPIWQVY
ncbi:MAG: histone deacetylase, partial [Deltaproteobacteria bacterium]